MTFKVSSWDGQKSARVVVSGGGGGGESAQRQPLQPRGARPFRAHSLLRSLWCVRGRLGREVITSQNDPLGWSGRNARFSAVTLSASRRKERRSSSSCRPPAFRCPPSISRKRRPQAPGVAPSAQNRCRREILRSPPRKNDFFPSSFFQISREYRSAALVSFA